MLSPIFSTLYNIRNVFQSDTRVSNSFRTKRSLLGLTFPRESTLKVWRKNCQISILLFILFIPRVTRHRSIKVNEKEMEDPWFSRTIATLASLITRSVDQFFHVGTRHPLVPASITPVFQFN